MALREERRKDWRDWESRNGKERKGETWRVNDNETGSEKKS